MNELYDVLKASKASDFLIREEQTERDDSGVDPLLLAMETFKDKKRYGGKRT